MRCSRFNRRPTSWMLCLTVDWELASCEPGGSCPRPVLTSTSSTCSLVRFWPAKMGEGSSFLGETFVKSVRLVGVPATESDCLLWWAGERHALVSFSPRIRRPSLAGLKGIVADCMLEGMWDWVEVGGRVGVKKDRKIHAAAGEVGSGPGKSKSTREQREQREQ